MIMIMIMITPWNLDSQYVSTASFFLLLYMYLSLGTPDFLVRDHQGDSFPVINTSPNRLSRRIRVCPRIFRQYSKSFLGIGIGSGEVDQYKNP